jgi:hypothetical protein
MLAMNDDQSSSLLRIISFTTASLCRAADKRAVASRTWME